ncbi:hypothetical protein EW145_g5491 [Phellinidium pouzarii]|uniref:Uncharacterized protein n=1 Tax=Phellinidium pouzarii TaxID=167371 RepID=A0A4V3XC45_9AGAM|nr:hypothetical protein EW145_g5491 [Phellinidium pouzarii]
MPHLANLFSTKKDKTYLAMRVKTEKDAQQFKQSIDNTFSKVNPDYRASRSFEKVKQAYDAQRRGTSSSSSPSTKSDSHFVRKSSLRSSRNSGASQHTPNSDKRVRFEVNETDVVVQILDLLRVRSSHSVHHIVSARSRPGIVRAPSFAANISPMSAEFVEYEEGSSNTRLSLNSDETCVQPLWQTATSVLLIKSPTQDRDLSIINPSLKSGRLRRSDAQRIPAIPKRHKLFRNFSLIQD